MGILDPPPFRKPASGWHVSDLDLDLQQKLLNTEGFLTWGEAGGVHTWDQVYAEQTNWASAQSFTWGELAGVHTWAHVNAAQASWASANSFTWETV